MAPVDVDKLRQHVDHIRGNLRRLRGIAAKGRGAFLADEIAQAASIRYLQTAIEAMIDVANHVISREGLGVPRSYAEAMELLVDRDLVLREHRKRLVEMVRFRNRAVHLYDRIDAPEVFDILESHLSDFDLFLQAVTKRYFEAT